MSDPYQPHTEQIETADGQRPFFWSAAWFSTVLSAYYIVRPVREALGSMDGATRLKYFFAAVFLTMLVAVPVYSELVSRFNRRRLVPIVYRFLALNLLVFSFLMRLPDGFVAKWVAPVFFVWVSVYVMFLTSLFWSVQADVFTKERGKQLFGRISASGTAGAIVASLTMGVTATLIGPANMLLISAALMEIGLFCFRRLDPPARVVSPTDNTAGSGNPLEGFAQVVQSPYLFAILLYTFTTTFCSTSLYMQQADVVNAVWPDRDMRTAIFALLDFGTLITTAVIQVAIAGPVIRRSVGLAMCLLPLVYAVGFTGLSFSTSIYVLLPLIVLSRACTYGFSVPAIGVLYTIVSRADKYKAKSIIDTLVIRGGDAVTTWTVSGLRSLGTAASALAGLLVPVAGVSMLLAIYLGRRNAQHQPK